MSLAYDSSSAGDWFSGTTCNYNFNNAAGDLLIVYAESGGGIGNITGVTYNGVAMTQFADVEIDATPDQRGTFWLLFAPATGTHVVACTRATSTSAGLFASFPISVSGARQAVQPEVTNTTGPVVATAFNANVVTLTANAMHVALGSAYPGRAITGTDTAGATLRATQLLGRRYWFTKPTTTAGSDDIHMLGDASGGYLSTDLSIAEFGAPVVSPSASQSPSSSISPSSSASPSASVSPSVSHSPSPSSSISRSPSPSVSPSSSASPSASVSASVSLSPSPSASQSPSGNLSPSASASPSASRSPSTSASPSASPSRSPSTSPSSSGSPSASASASRPPSPSLSPSPSPSEAPPEATLVTDVYSDIDMADPPSYYFGFKAARVKRFGAGERSLSHIRTGDWNGATFDFEIWDGDGLINGWLASVEGRYWTEALTIRMVDRDTTRRALGLPYTVFSGPIVDAKPRARPRVWDITLGDRVSQGLLSDQAQAPWRRIGDGFLSQLVKKADGLDPDTPEPRIYGVHKRLPTDGPSGEGLVYAPTYLGIMLLDGVNVHVWLVAGHACADVPAQYVDYVASGDFSVQNGVDYVSDTFGNLRRYTLVTAPVTDPTFLDPAAAAPAPEDVTDPDACAHGQKALTVWVEGVEPNGDGSGAVMKRRLLQYQHWCINDVAHQGQESYMSGPWLENPEWTVSDGPVPIVDEDSFTECDAIAFERFPTDDGYTGAGIIGARAGDRKSLKEWIADWNRSCSCRFGVTHKGQLRIVMLHPTEAIKAAAPLFDDALEILEGTFDPNVLWTEHATVIPFKADIDHVKGDYTLTSAAISADTKYRRAITGETRTYPFAPGITNSWHLAAIELLVFQYPPRTVQFDTGLTDLATLDLGDYFNYRHFATITDTVGQVRLAQITKHQVQAGARRVLVEALDCEDLIGYDIPGEGPLGLLNDRCSRAKEFVFTEPAEGMSWWQRFTQNTGPQTQDTSITALVSPNSDKKPAWFKFTAPSDGNLSVITTTTAYDDVLYFLDGTCGEGEWTILNSNDDSVGATAGATVDLLRGQTVYILIVGKTDDAFGFLLAQASFAPA